ncbi:MAG: DUF374 domain-containing protein [Planctomycetes bacterium]|nr:DUF374 domain-containing protein [Planctomycetota bacterium]
MRRFLFQCLGCLGAVILVLWRLTLRIRVADDPRPALREAGRRYVYAILHAHQLSFIFLSDDTPIAAMVSASRDGDALVPLCRVRGVIPVRGSTRKKGKDKGGGAALAQLIELVSSGTPALLAVDGPRGPRSTVHRGVIGLALATDACIVISGVFPTRRKLLTATWDRTQIPLPFSTLHGRFRTPIDSRDFKGDSAGFRAKVAAELLAIEQEWDPEEAAHAVPFSPSKNSPPKEVVAEAPATPPTPAETSNTD